MAAVVEYLRDTRNEATAEAESAAALLVALEIEVVRRTLTVLLLL